jgi:ketosteroid isomerase-like protein
MTFFAHDCTFEAVAGPEVHGQRFVGAEATRKAFADVWGALADAHWNHHGHFVYGDRAISEWTFSGTYADGTRIEVEGCDLFTLRNGKIGRKQAFRKQRPILPA